MIYKSIFFTIFSLLIFVTAHAKTALIIGNAYYKSAPQAQSDNDANDLADALLNLGFSVTIKFDLTKTQIIDALIKYSQAKASSDINLFYYSGRGMQHNRNNYIVPIDAEINSYHDIPYECIPVKQVLRRLKKTNGIDIVMLDACHQNPHWWYADTSEKGLTPIPPPADTLISMPAQPGATTLSSIQRNSTFMTHFLKNLASENIPIEILFHRTMRDVTLETGGRQVPWNASSVTKDVCLRLGLHIESFPIPDLSIKTIGGKIDPIEIPQFPWPPPVASARVNVPNAFFFDQYSNAPGTYVFLKNVDRQICSALDRAGYFDKSYWAVPDGFAIVTRLEQINEDGSSKQAPDRWSKETNLMNNFSLGAYLKALFTCNPGYYRVIVFIITPVPFTQSMVTVNESQTQKWLLSGYNKLPDSIGWFHYTPQYTCTALIYLFEKQGGSQQDDIKLQIPGKLTGRHHLVRASLWSYLGE